MKKLYPALYTWVNPSGECENFQYTTNLYSSYEEAFKDLAYDYTGKPRTAWHEKSKYGQYKLIRLVTEWPIIIE